MSALSVHKIENLADMGDVCFKYVFAGAGHFSALEAESYLSLVGIKLRDQLVSHLLRQPTPDAAPLDVSAKPKRHRILVIQKSETNKVTSFNDFNHIYNNYEVVNMLRDTLGDVADIVPYLPDKFTWAEQVI
jgi:hypothetical protein